MIWIRELIILLDLLSKNGVLICLCVGGLTFPVQEDPGEDGDPGVQAGLGVSPHQNGALLHGP